MTIQIDPNFPGTFDAVVMLTVSDWNVEPRSNRYHYATRFARNRPVIFVQADRDTVGFEFEPSGYQGIELLHLDKEWGPKQTAALAEALSIRGILRPLFWIYSANYLHAVENIFSDLRILHATDDYFSHELKSQLSPGYFNRLFSLFDNVDLLVAVSAGVLDSYVREGRFRGNTLLLENGCDFSFWQKALNASANMQIPQRPVAFYQGGINYRFDYALMTELANANPDWDFRLCGVCFATSTTWEKLLGLPNVNYLGVLIPEEIAKEAIGATAGLIPFVRTPLMQEKALPLKAFEYVACGLPVVTIPIDSLARWPEQFLFATNATEFSTQMERARACRYETVAIRRRLEVAAQQDYDRRFHALMAKVSGLNRGPSNKPKQKLSVLYLYSANSTYTATVQEYLSSFAKYSRHNIVFAEGVREAPCSYNMGQFDVVLVHYSVRLTLDDYISPAVVKNLKRCGSYKVLFIQDEYEHTERARAWIEEIGFHAVFSCVPDGQIAKVYPPDRFKSTEFSSILTGYVPETLEKSRFGLPLQDRPVVLGYRGRQLPFRFGQLAQEKYLIGLRMREFCERRGIKYDIEWEENKRIYGDKWYEFIGNCRAMLGTESGSNVFDFDGTLHTRTDEAIQQAPGMSFEEFHNRFLRDLDGKIRMNQISPRVFEAIAIGTPLVLFEGNYSGVVRPGEHYISLKKDFSNVHKVLDSLDDVDALQSMADRAWRHVIKSGTYSYRAFVEYVDDFLQRRVNKVKPWVPLSVAIGQIRSDSNDVGLVSDLLRGSAVSWPLPYSSYSAEISSQSPPPAAPAQITVKYVSQLQTDPNQIPARALIVSLSRRAALRAIKLAPPNLHRVMKEWLRKIAAAFGLVGGN